MARQRPPTAAGSGTAIVALCKPAGRRAPASRGRPSARRSGARLAQRDDRAAHVGWVQMDLGHVLELHCEHLPHSELASPLARRRQVGDLEHQHVAAIAAAALDQAPGRGVRPLGRHDLQEGVPEREHGVAQAEVADARIG